MKDYIVPVSLIILLVFSTVYFFKFVQSYNQRSEEDHYFFFFNMELFIEDFKDNNIPKNYSS